MKIIVIHIHTFLLGTMILSGTIVRFLSTKTKFILYTCNCQDSSKATPCTTSHPRPTGQASQEEIPPLPCTTIYQPEETCINPLAAAQTLKSDYCVNDNTHLQFCNSFCVTHSELSQPCHTPPVRIPGKY